MDTFSFDEGLRCQVKMFSVKEHLDHHGLPTDVNKHLLNVSLKRPVVKLWALDLQTEIALC